MCVCVCAYVYVLSRMCVGVFLQYVLLACPYHKIFPFVHMHMHAKKTV